MHANFLFDFYAYVYVASVSMIAGQRCAVLVVLYFLFLQINSSAFGETWLEHLHESICFISKFFG
ncbi:hypothetical protein T4B_14195 [Trichinella pseudospiralis]|uniref:Uncharacterized protein n=1 Tax=Trichinella pseudospiralis TaxID=6337 RepID=A0A0V1GFG5_TRIPS|nr:hypothetical protein T4B_14195 [Trichinella pseudospiralis]